MFNNKQYEVTSMEKCVLLDAKKHITSKEFNIRIPRLMPKLPFTPPTSWTETTGKSNLLNKVEINSTVKMSNYLNSKSMTDYRSWIFGQIYKMSHSEGVTDTEIVPEDGSFTVSPAPTRTYPEILYPLKLNGIEPRPASWNFISMDLTHDHLYTGHVGTPQIRHLPAPHSKHAHPITKPFQFFNVKYEELNNREIKFGKEMVGCFISGDLNDFRINHIPDVIPMEGD